MPQRPAYSLRACAAANTRGAIPSGTRAQRALTDVVACDSVLEVGVVLDDLLELLDLAAHGFGPPAAAGGMWSLVSLEDGLPPGAGKKKNI